MQCNFQFSSGIGLWSCIAGLHLQLFRGDWFMLWFYLLEISWCRENNSKITLLLKDKQILEAKVICSFTCGHCRQEGRNWIWGWLSSSCRLYSDLSQKEYGLVCKFWAEMTIEENQLSLFCELMKLVMNMSGGKSGMLCAVQRLRNALKISLSCLSQETKTLSWVKLKEISMYGAV